MPVLTMDPSLLREAARLCGRAFAEDPLYVAAMGDRQLRERCAEAIAAWYLRYCLRYGEALAAAASPAIESAGRGRTASPLGGVALFLPPGAAAMPPGKSLRAGMLRLPFEAGPGSLGALLRLARIEPVANRAWREEAPPGAWYLLFLAVDPALQGKGVGSSLLRPFLAARDALGETVYLETQNPRNLDLYARFGFALVGERPVPGLAGVAHFSMLRRPRR